MCLITSHAVPLMASILGGASMAGPRDWENPAVVGINKRRAHVPLRSFTAPEQAWQHFALPPEAPTAAASPRLLSLNGGDWRFKLHARPEAVPPAFIQPEFQEDGSWSEVGAAGWVLQGEQSCRAAAHTHLGGRVRGGCNWVGGRCSRVGRAAGRQSTPRGEPGSRWVLQGRCCRVGRAAGGVAAAGRAGRRADSRISAGGGAGPTSLWFCLNATLQQARSGNLPYAVCLHCCR